MDDALSNHTSPDPLAESPNSVSHPNFSPYADRPFGRNNENWLNLRHFTSDPIVLSPWIDVLVTRLVAGRRWVVNYVVFSWPEDEDAYYKLVARGPVETYKQWNPLNKTLTDGATVFEFTPCAPIKLLEPLYWEILDQVNDIPLISVILWG